MSLLSKYKQLKKKRQLELDPNVEFCPYPNCNSYAIKKDGNNSVSCIHNGHKFCFNCHNYWHDKGICNIDIYNFYKKWKVSNKIKRCPRCKYLTEKNEGCNHMTCFNCKYEWCWICKNEYKPGHYDLGSRCYGLQFTKNSWASNRCCAILKQIGIYLLTFLLALFFFPFFIFFSLYKRIFERFYIFYGRRIKFLFYITIFLQYIWWSVFIYIIILCTLIIMIFICPLRRKVRDLLRYLNI